MNTLVIAVIVVAVALAGIYFVMRPRHSKVRSGRHDDDERHELTGGEQYKHRNPPPR